MGRNIRKTTHDIEQMKESSEESEVIQVSEKVEEGV